MLDSLRSPTVVPTAEAPVLVVAAAGGGPEGAVRALAAKPSTEDPTAAPVQPQRHRPPLGRPESTGRAGLDDLVALESAVRTDPHRDTLAPTEQRLAAPDPAVLDLPGAAEPEVVDAGPASQAGIGPAWQAEIDRLNERLSRVEAASAMAATTLDRLVQTFDSGQQSTVAAAQVSARKEARSVIAAEVHPALSEMSGASSHAQEEIHGVLTLLGTCLERVVGHLQKIERLSTGVVAAPREDAAVALREQSVSVDRQAEAPSPVIPAPAVPLPGFGRRSKLAALIDFGFGTRAA